MTSHENLPEIELNDTFIISEQKIDYIIIDCDEYRHYSFINYDVFSSFIKLCVINNDNYYTFILTKNGYHVIYEFYSIDKIINYVYNYHTIKLNN